MAQVPAQTLDQRAWNALWDQFETVVPRNNLGDRVQALENIMPAAWLVKSDEDPDTLLRIVDTIPADRFSMNWPTRTPSSLHQIYATYVFDVYVPQPSAKQRTVLAEAAAKQAKAYQELETRREELDQKWALEAKRLKARQEDVTPAVKRRFWEANAGSLNEAQARVDLATADLQRVKTPASWIGESVNRTMAAMNASRAGLSAWVWEAPGGYKEQDCDAQGAGWTRLNVNRLVIPRVNRSSDWNGNGVWRGRFVQAGDRPGEGARELDGVDQVTIGFCGLAYVPVRPGDWFDMTLLEAIDSRNVPLKKESPLNGKRALGETGAIPRIVKGLFVASRVEVYFRGPNSRIEELKQVFAGGEGIRVGPWSLSSGSGAQVKFSSQTVDEGWRLSAHTNFPLVLAVLVAPTGQK